MTQLELDRHPAHPADAHAGADRALRVPVVRRSGRRPRLARRRSSTGAIGRAGAPPRWTRRTAGSRSPSPGTDCALWAWTRRRWQTFPEEFRQGMAARAEMLGDTGANHPDHWVGGLASPDLHAIAILFARDDAERDQAVAEHRALVDRCPGRARRLLARPRGDAAVRSRARPLRLPRPALAAGDRRVG